MSSFNGVSVFRIALLMEVAANIGSILLFFLMPETCLSYFVKGPNMITPATKSIIQWLSAVVAAFTVPLLLSYPNPPPNRGGDKEVVALRKMTYTTLGSGEMALAAIFVYQYLAGDSGMTDTALLIATAAMGTFLGMRVFFLFVKPGWIEVHENAKKAQ